MNLAPPTIAPAAAAPHAAEPPPPAPPAVPVPAPPEPTAAAGAPESAASAASAPPSRAGFAGFAGDVPRGPVPAYAYDLTLDPAARSLTGTGQITVTNTQDEPLDKVVLRLWANTPYLAGKGGKATVSDINVDGAPAPNAVIDRSVVTVPLAKPLARGESAKLGFGVSVTVPSVMDRTGRGDDGTLYFGNALPLVAVRDDEGWNVDPYVVEGESFYNLAANWDVKVTAPADTQLITTGSQKAATVVDGATGTSEFTAPNARDFIVVAAHGYQLLQQQVGATNVRVWAPAHDTAVAKDMLQTATQSLDFYNKRYGSYAAPEYDVVDTHGMGGGMEYPGVTLNDPVDGRAYTRTVVAHETGHQYFYGIDGNNEYDDPFLDESFATFVTSEFEHESPATVLAHLQPGLHAHAQRAAAAGLGGGDDASAGAPPPAPGVATPTAPAATPPGGVHVSSPMNVLVGHGYFDEIYGTGARVLGQLKQEVGDQAFAAGMRAHFERNRDGIATTAGFMDAMSSAAGRDLTAWFNAHSVYASEPAANDHTRDPNTSM